MYLYKFEEGEVIVNTLTAYPSHDMYLYEQNVYIDRRPELAGASRAASGVVIFNGSPAVDQTITIVSADGTSKAYIAKAAENLGVNPPQFLRTPSGSAATSLKNCIESANGHNGSILVARSGYTGSVEYGTSLQLQQDVTGTGGNRKIESTLENVFSNGFSLGDDLNTENVTMVPSSDISLFELNIDRPITSVIYPFTIKDGTKAALKTVSAAVFNSAELGDELTGSYPMSASISVDHVAAGADDIGRKRITSLRNSLNYYAYLSPQYEYSRSAPDGWEKSTQELSLLSVPSIFYGSTLKKGSMNLRFYITGTLFAQLNDEARNGELVQVGPTGSEGSGSVAGVVLYEEGCVLLTGSWDLSTIHTENYLGGGAVAPQWRYFGTNISASISTPNSSWAVSFEGTNRIPSIMMFANAPKNQLIHSNNPTYLLQASSSANSVITSSIGYSENSQLAIKNIGSSSFLGYDKAFEKTTYISKVAIYDDKKNIIGVAKLANPVKKTANREFTFKLKLDI